MQENNNFQKIISQWRRLSGEQVESTALISMSGDSHHPEKKEEDSERHLLMPDSSKLPLAVAGASATSVLVEPEVITGPEEKQENTDPEKKDEPKEASGDSQNNEKKSDGDYLEHKESQTDRSQDSKGEKEKGDNVDSVYLRPPPAHKARSNASTPPVEEEDCGIKCLYYTLQCCDCVLM